MTYHSLTEIFTVKKRALENISHFIGGLTPEQASFHPESGGWSIAEVTEHLVLVENQMLTLFSGLIKRTEEAGKILPANMPFEISVDAIAERSKGEKYLASEKAIPSGTMQVHESLNKLKELQSQLFELQPKLETIDVTYSGFPHRIFGQMTLGQWLVFVGLHEERHLGQMERIVKNQDC